MISKERFKKVFDQVYSVKRVKPVIQEIEKKILSNLKLTIPEPEKIKKSIKKDLFAPINQFATTNTNLLDLSELYDTKLLPSQSLSTSKHTMNRLTKNIYIKPKYPEFPFKFPNVSIDQSKLKIKRKKKNNSLKHLDRNASFEEFNKTCTTVLRENKRSMVFFNKKQNFMKKKILDVKKIVENLEKSNKRVDFYLFEKRLKEAHKHLVDKDMIHPKNELTKIASSEIIQI